MTLLHVLRLLVKGTSVSFFCFFKQETVYEMRISDWSSDVCSSDLADDRQGHHGRERQQAGIRALHALVRAGRGVTGRGFGNRRSCRAGAERRIETSQRPSSRTDLKRGACPTLRAQIGRAHV